MPRKKGNKQYIGVNVRNRIIQLKGEYYDHKEIVEMIKEEFSLELDRLNIRQICHKYKENIRDYQAKLLEKLNEIPVTSIYYRMQMRQKLIDKEKRKDKPSSRTIAQLLRDAAEEYKVYIQINLDADKLAALRETYDDWEKYAREQEYAEFTDITPAKLAERNKTNEVE